MLRRPGGLVGLAPGAAGAQAGAPVPSGGRTELALALMVMIWGVNFAVVKWALEVFDPLGFNALRYLIASVFVFAVLRAQGALRLPERRDLPRILGLGLVGNTAYQLAFIWGLDRTRAGNASLLLALVPIFVLLMDRRGDRQGAWVWIGSILSVVGVALVSGDALRLEGSETLVGDLLMAAAAAIWAFYTVGARPLIQRYGSMQTTAWTLWVGAAGIFLIGVPELAGQNWGAIGPWAWAGLLYSALLSIGLAYLLWYRGVERLGGAQTAIFTNVTPVVALLTGALWLGERLTVFSVAGAALVLVGLMLVRRR